MIKDSIKKIIKAFQILEIYDKDFFEFIKSRTSYFPNTQEFLPWACFPIFDSNNILKDIKLIVPFIVDDKTLLINIHEYYHAYELYQELGLVYEENKDIREKNAKNMEIKYLEKHHNNNS